MNALTQKRLDDMYRSTFAVLQWAPTSSFSVRSAACRHTDLYACSQSLGAQSSMSETML